MIASAERADAGDGQVPRKAASDGDQPAFSFHGYGTADDLLLPHLPCIPSRICIPLGPDTAEPRRNDPVNDTLPMSRRRKDDHVTLPQVLQTAGNKTNSVTRSEQGPHALAAAENRVTEYFIPLVHIALHDLPTEGRSPFPAPGFLLFSPRTGPLG